MLAGRVAAAQAQVRAERASERVGVSAPADEPESDAEGVASGCALDVAVLVTPPTVPEGSCIPVSDAAAGVSDTGNGVALPHAGLTEALNTRLRVAAADSDALEVTL